MTGRAAKGRTGRALLTCYAIEDDTIISSRGFITAVAQTQTAAPRPFKGAGLCAVLRLAGRDSELVCVCSRTGVSIEPGLGPTKYSDVTVEFLQPSI